MDSLIRDLRSALHGGLFTLALQGTLALIDVSAALASESGDSDRERFKRWFATHLGAQYETFSPQDVWRLRCGMLHQGRASASGYSAVIFALPGGLDVHNVIIDDTYVLNLARFCDDVISAVEQWWGSHQHDVPVAANAENLVRVRPEGLDPYIIGMPLLA